MRFEEQFAFMCQVLVGFEKNFASGGKMSDSKFGNFPVENKRIIVVNKQRQMRFKVGDIFIHFTVF